MDDCRSTAFYLTVWYAVLSAIVTILLIALNDVGLATGLMIAANAALLFALILMTRAGHLTDTRITRGQFWRTLPVTKRPRGEGGLRMARKALEETSLQFAKGAAAVAVVFSAAAYASSGVSAADFAKAVRMPTMTKAQTGNATWSGYSTARLLPIN